MENVLVNFPSRRMHAIYELGTAQLWDWWYGAQIPFALVKFDVLE